MLKELQKALGMKPAEKQVTTETLELKLDTSDIQATVDAMKAEFDEFKQTAEALLAESEAKTKSLTEQLEAANALVADFRAAAVMAEAEKLQAVADAAAAKLAGRKEKLVALLGTERADALLTVTENMEDAGFDAVVSALGVGAAAEADAPLFKEVGATVEADAAQIVETAEMRALKSKYGKK